MRALVPFVALLLSTALLVTGHGLQHALVPLRGESEAFGAFWVGGLGSGYFFGFMIGCMFVPMLVARVGHIRVFAALVGLASGTLLFYPLFVEAAFWVMLRILTGFCLAGLYIIIESWLNERTDNANRGLVLSAYIIVNFAAVTFGQLLLVVFPLDSFALFTLASVMFSFAAIPLALSKATQPAPLLVVRLNLRRLYKNTPLGLIGIFVIGIIQGIFWSFGGVFAARSGLATEQVAIFMSVAVAAGALGQWPFGRLSDRMDRRLVLLALLGLSTLACLAVFFASPTTFTLLLVCGFAFGLVTLPAYSIVVAHAYDHAEPNQHVTMASGLLLIFAMGSICGPLIAPVFLEQLGPGGLFLFMAVAQAVLAVYVLVRLRLRDAVPEDERGDFSFAATAQMGAVLSETDLDEQDVDLIEPDQVLFEDEEEAR
ncbi:MAG: MFS transporter [Hyphomicrobiales bacterium]|jgi:MFS family permease